MPTEHRRAISSRQNPIVAAYRAAARGESPDHLLLDGMHLVDEAIESGVQIVDVAVASDAVRRPDVSRVLSALGARGVDAAVVTPAVMDALSPVRSASPIVALARRPPSTLDRVYTGNCPLVLIAADMQDPGNVGAIVRVAEAAGATGVVVTGASADPFGWKALRGSMGSALRLPAAVVTLTDEATAEARRRGCRIVATAPRGGRILFDVDLRSPVAILIGGEGAGLPPALIDAADERATIPMAPAVESLNAAVAAALVLYEARRQRHSADSRGH